MQEKISILMATYNHAAYVSKTIESVLKQRDVDFEFLIADDGSTDNTTNVIGMYNDARIHFTAHAINRGACTVLNELISKASGEYIAIINSDDVWTTSDKLNNQLSILKKNPSLGACFGKAKYIDASGLPIITTSPSVFDKENRSQGKWLRYFFESGNCLCHPTILIKKKCIDEIGEYNNNYRQLPDYDMWIRLLKKYPIYISDEAYVEFRLTGPSNTSSNTVKNSIRISNEHYLIAEDFFSNITREQLIDGFRDLLKFPEIPSDAHLEIEKTLLLFSPIKGLSRAYQMQGLAKLNKLMTDSKYRITLQQEYGIDGNWFQEKTSHLDILQPRIKAILSHKKSLIIDTIHKIKKNIFH